MMQYTSQPGPVQPSQPPLPQQGGQSQIWGPVQWLGNAEVAILGAIPGYGSLVHLSANAGAATGDAIRMANGNKSALDTILAKLADPSFWKATGLIAVAGVVGFFGLWLWLAGGKTTVVMKDGAKAAAA